MFDPDKMLDALHTAWTGDVIYVPLSVYQLIEPVLVMQTSGTPHDTGYVGKGRPSGASPQPTTGRVQKDSNGNLMWRGKTVLVFDENQVVAAYKHFPIHRPKLLQAAQITIEFSLQEAQTHKPKPATSNPPPKREQPPVQKPVQKPRTVNPFRKW